jgi:hypothetical protein
MAAADTLRREARALESEAHVLNTDAERFELSAKSKRRLGELPGQIAEAYARADEAAAKTEADEEAIRAAYNVAQEAYVDAIRELLDRKAELDAIGGNARALGIYPGPPLQVLAHQNRELHGLLNRARGTAFA